MFFFIKYNAKVGSTTSRNYYFTVCFVGTRPNLQKPL